jgi:hypothetical protein
MSNPNEKREALDLEQLTSSIREMASRVNAEFVVDSRKSENYLTARQLSESSERKSSQSRV